MLRTSFVPLEHGYHFSNNDIEWKFLFVHGKNLCGGMMYSALDYYFNRMVVPSQRKPPPVGSELNDYITDRQMTAHLNTVPRMAAGRIFWFTAQWFEDSVADEYDILRSRVAAGLPTVLFLVEEEFMTGHHVMVIGCQDSPTATGGTLLLEVYDPNCQDKVSEIHIDRARKRFELRPPGYGIQIVKGFFVDPGYDLQRPPVIPDEPAPRIPMPRSPYRVEDGDTLRGLALRFYGHETRWADIHEANRSVVGRNLYRLKTGQILTIPD